MAKIIPLAQQKLELAFQIMADIVGSPRDHWEMFIYQNKPSWDRERYSREAWNNVLDRRVTEAACTLATAEVRRMGGLKYHREGGV